MEKPTKQEYKVATWLRRNVPTKRTKFLNHNVEYFTSSKALDALMESKFAKGDNPVFATREAAIEMLDTMLVHKLFHRGKKVTVTEQELKGKAAKAAKDKDTKETTTTKTSKDTKDHDKTTDAEGAQTDGGAAAKEKTEKKKRKIRLEMHPEQLFVDGSEAYVWIYDPIPMHYWLFGACLVVGAILLCLFPLWPASMRKGVYYLSIAAAGFLTFILGLVVLRFIVFCIIWVLTGSKYHFWLFPNLTEDVGFCASFWPIYMYEYRANGEKPEKKGKSKKAVKKDKDSDAEEEVPKSPKEKSGKRKQAKEEEVQPLIEDVQAEGYSAERKG